jgi:hypothetical protein
MAHAVMRECSNAGGFAGPFHGFRRLPILLAGRFRRALIVPWNCVPVAQMDRAVVS